MRSAAFLEASADSCEPVKANPFRTEIYPRLAWQCRLIVCRLSLLIPSHAFRNRQGGSMKSRRHAASAALVACMILAVALAASRISTAQQKPADKPAQPAEKKELLTVEPAAKPTPPDKSPQKPPTKIQLPGAEADDKNPVITNTDLITFTVTVTDIYGRFVSGLGKNAFSIFEDKAQQEITFFSDDDSPVSVGILFDVSGSMSGDKVRRARDALSHFVQTSHDRDEYFLIGFNSRANLLMDRTRDAVS
jgi:hypothetical protein